MRPIAVACHQMRQHTPAVLKSSKGEGMDVKVCVRVFILIFVDEVHHFLCGTLALLDAGLFAPFIDCIDDGGVNIFANVLKGFA